MKIIAKTNFSLNGVFYEKGYEVKVDTISQLVALNERGFIEPITAKDIQSFNKKTEEKIIEKPRKIEKKNEEEE